MTYTDFYNELNNEKNNVIDYLKNGRFSNPSKYFDEPIIVDSSDKTSLGPILCGKDQAVYVFRLKEGNKFCINIEKFNAVSLVNTSKIRMFDKKLKELKSKDVYYVGECKKVNARFSSHISSKSIGTRGLHLSLLNRKELRDRSEVIIFPFKKDCIPTNPKGTIVDYEKICRVIIEKKISSELDPCIGE